VRPQRQPAPPVAPPRLGAAAGPESRTRRPLGTGPGPPQRLPAQPL